MKRYSATVIIAFLMTVSPALIARDAGLGFDEDYYLGFSQGAYYGLMLAGVEYDVAWCVKSELDYEGAQMGTGGEFQSRLNAIYDACRPPD